MWTEEQLKNQSPIDNEYIAVYERFSRSRLLVSEAGLHVDVQSLLA